MPPTFGVSKWTLYLKISSRVGEFPFIKKASPFSVSPSTNIFVFVKELSSAQL